MYNPTFMARVIELSLQAIDRPGTQPFGSVVVQKGKIVGEGLNYALAKHDPTSHGEIEAIRDACQRLRTTDLSDCELYAIGEPCPMCAVALRLAGIRHLYYGATHADATKAYEPFVGSPYQDIGVTVLQEQAGLPLREQNLPSSQHMRLECVDVYDQWAKATVKQLAADR